MKRIATVGLAACIVITGITSCKKSSSSSPATTTTSSNAPTINYGNVDGGFVSLKTSVTTVVSGFPLAVTTESAVASFFAATGNNSSFVDGGTVSVNTYALTQQSNKSYIKTISPGSTTSDLGFSSDNSNWNISGAGSVPSFTYNDNAPFPAFTGTVPDSITRSSGLTVSFSGASNADSIIVFIYAGSTSVMRTYAGSVASATLSSSDLSALPVTSNKSAVMEIVPYRFTVVAEGSKHYIFIKELAVVKNINIY